MLVALHAFLLPLGWGVAAPDVQTGEETETIYRLLEEAGQHLFESDGADADIAFAEAAAQAGSSVDCSEHHAICAEVENMRGSVSYIRGELKGARKHFQQAIEIAGANVRLVAMLLERQAHLEWRHGDRLRGIAAINSAAHGWRSEFMDRSALGAYTGFFISLEECTGATSAPCSVDELREALDVVSRAQALSRELRTTTRWFDPGLISLWRGSVASDRLARRLDVALQGRAPGNDED